MNEIEQGRNKCILCRCVSEKHLMFLEFYFFFFSILRYLVSRGPCLMSCVPLLSLSQCSFLSSLSPSDFPLFPPPCLAPLYFHPCLPMLSSRSPPSTQQAKKFAFIFSFFHRVVSVLSFSIPSFPLSSLHPASKIAFIFPFIFMYLLPCFSSPNPFLSFSPSCFNPHSPLFSYFHHLHFLSSPALTA